MAIARERSFTRAAARMGVSQSALSHTLRALEASIGIRLITRTTRSVSPTEAGERLLRTLAPCIEDIEATLAALSTTGAGIAGTVRIRSTDYAADTVLRPRLAGFLARRPALRVEISIDDGPGEETEMHHDMGVRWGDQVAKNMVAVRIGPDCRMAIVGAPAYLRSRLTPETPHDLLAHNCTTLRLPNGVLAAWELSRGRRKLAVKVEGQAVFNGLYPMLDAALAGCGLAFLPRDLVGEHLAAGRLAQVLADWSPAIAGLHVHMSSRLSTARAVSAVVEALRYRR